MGAQGIGLARTEHMFLGSRRELVERLILAETDDEVKHVYDALLPLQIAFYVVANVMLVLLGLYLAGITA